MISEARRLFDQYAGCVLGPEVRDALGDLAVGAAFHIGDGFFITAGTS